MGSKPLDREADLLAVDVPLLCIGGKRTGRILVAKRLGKDLVAVAGKDLKDLAVSGSDLLALGYSGRQIGEKLQYLLEQVLDEQLPNEKNALLSALNKEETL